MKSSLAALAVVLSCASSPASSQVDVAAGIGPSWFDGDCSFATCDDRSRALRVRLGYRLGGPWSIEAAYTDQGSLDGPEGFGRDTDIDFRGLSVGAAYALPLGADWEGVVRGGLARNRTRTPQFEFSDTGGGVIRFRDLGTRTQTKTSPYAGLGASYRLTPSLALGADLDLTRYALGSGRSTVVSLLATIRASF